MYRAYFSELEMPEALKAVGLSLDEANVWQAIYQRVVDLGAKGGEAVARAWGEFKDLYERVGGRWMPKHKKPITEVGRRNNKADRDRIFSVVKTSLDLLAPEDREAVLSQVTPTAGGFGRPGQIAQHDPHAALKSATQESSAEGVVPGPTSGRAPSRFSSVVERHREALREAKKGCTCARAKEPPPEPDEDDEEEEEMMAEGCGKKKPKVKNVAEMILAERTPGIARALRALASAKKRNANKAAEGKPVVIAGKEVSADTYKKQHGLPSRLKES